MAESRSDVSETNAFTIPLFGGLSDRLGCRVVYRAGAGLGLIWTFAFFPLPATKQPMLIVPAVVAAFALLITCIVLFVVRARVNR